MLGIALFLSLDAQCTPCNVVFYTSNYGYKIHENPEHCSFKIYPLTTFLNRTDDENKSHCVKIHPRTIFLAVTKGWPKGDLRLTQGRIQGYLRTTQGWTQPHKWPSPHLGCLPPAILTLLIEHLRGFKGSTKQKKKYQNTISQFPLIFHKPTYRFHVSFSSLQALNSLLAFLLIGGSQKQP